MNRQMFGALCAALLVPALAGCSVSGSPKATTPAVGAPAYRGGGAAPAATTAPGTNGAPGANTAPTTTTDAAGAQNEIDPGRMPQSTFALDVDTASYDYARRLIDEGQRPSPSQVRQEEFINAFAQDYPEPLGSGFSVTADGAQLPDSYHASDAADTRLLRIGLRTRGDELGERPDVALTFVIDTSGSMADPGKLDLVQDALGTLIDQLRPTDSVAIVTFNTEATVVRRMTRASERAALHAAVDRLAAGGSTNLGAGLTTGYDVARAGFRPDATNRVVILSDGLANTGDTQAASILRSVRENAAKQITLLGVGVGNDYGDALMEKLADSGDGFTVYVTDRAKAQDVFLHRLPATASLRALDAKAQVTFDPTTVASYRLIGYTDRALAASQFRDDRVDGGEVAAGFTVTAIYSVRLKPEASGPVATARVRWLDPQTREPNEIAADVSVADLGQPFASASPRLQVSYVAAYFAEYLRGSVYGQAVRLPDLATIASQAADRTDDGDVATLAETIRRAEELR